MAQLASARRRFHASLLASVLRVGANGVPSNADKDNRKSVDIAAGILESIQGTVLDGSRMPGQRSGLKFEEACADFIRETFLQLPHLRPGAWSVEHIRSRERLAIARFQQYSHLVLLDDTARASPGLAAVLGGDYMISPDIVVAREPVGDTTINAAGHFVDASVATNANLRRGATSKPLLHASISCKWTMRSDRAQNARSEALNLIRNRKGHLPHIAVVTAEPLPSRLSSIALGTGDIDCVYHFALPELRAAVEGLGDTDTVDALLVMIDGQRLKDISDLTIDLCV